MKQVAPRPELSTGSDPVRSSVWFPRFPPKEFLLWERIEGVLANPPASEQA